MVDDIGEEALIPSEQVSKWEERKINEIKEKVFSAKRYIDLPNRLIISSPFCDRPLISYGIIAYCSSTRRWLLVNRRHSPEEIFMMRGSYRNCEIPRLLNGKSRDELSRDEKSIGNEAYFRDRFISTIGTSEKDCQYAWERFNEAQPLISRYLREISGKPTTGWLFPKGRMFSPYETPYKCALREFQEETGISILEYSSRESGKSNLWKKGVHLVSPRPLVESFRASNGRIYETRCWIYVFEKEIEPPPISDLNLPGEIGDRRWVSEEEAFHLLSPTKFSLLQTAQRLIYDKMGSSKI